MNHTSKHLELIELRIAGMHCGSCEIILERAFRNIPGVVKAHANSTKGTARIHADPEHLPSIETLSAVVKKAGYSMVAQDTSPETAREHHADSAEISGTQKWLEIGAALIVILALYQVLKGLGIADFASSVSGTATLGGVFLIGIVAGLSSCLAVTGGLLLSVTGKWNELHPNQDGWTKFKPLLAFNIGRLVSYLVLGGVVGWIGTSISLSPQMGGYLSIAVALVMLSLALSMLKIIPKGSCPIRPPKRLSHWIADMSGHPHPAAPFILGGLTFFLPCGFTQSLQLVALASGSFTMGALIMFSFALGTLPALLGLSAISATAKGTYSRIFLRFVGTLVLLLSLWNLQSGLTLVGIDTASILAFGENATDSAYAKNTDPNVTIAKNGDQIINLTVDGRYQPGSFTIEAGKTTWVSVNAKRISGCTSIITVPKFGLTARLQQGKQVRLGPIKNPTSDFTITCSMGMVSARVRVVKPGSLTAQVSDPPSVGQAEGEDTTDAANAKITDPNVTIAENGDQTINLTVDGRYKPGSFTIEAGKTTWVSVDAKRISGCTSIITVPKFGLQARLEQGKTARMGPIENPTSDFIITCSMGMVSARVRVVEPGTIAQALNEPAAAEDAPAAPRACGNGCGCGGA